MPSLQRSVIAVVVGCLAAFFHIGAIESLNYLLYPPPAGLDPAKPETLVAYMKEIPPGALLVVLLAWVVGTFAGSWITTRLAPIPKRNHGLVIGALFLIAAIGNMSAIPHPLWFWVVSLASFLPVSYLGAALAAPRSKPVSEPSDLGGPQP
jgi:hypothetical protein